jgi:hypothetical protein
MAGYKARAMALAAEHGIEIDSYAALSHGEMYGDVNINLPRGWVLSASDDRTGLSTGACGTYNQFWLEILKDVQWLVSEKDQWLFVGENEGIA